MKSLKSIFARAALPVMLAMVPAIASAQSSPIPINGCGVISPDPGGNKNYVLTQNLNAPGGGVCLQFQGVANATIDGQGHAVAAGIDASGISNPLILQNSPSATIKNVTFVGAVGTNTLRSQILVQNSPNVNIVSNVFNNPELVIDQPSTTPFIGGNTFNNAVGYSAADHTAFLGNTFAFTDGRQYGWAIAIVGGGSGHNIRSNTINGGWDGQPQVEDGFNQMGCDDGIILTGGGPNDPISAYVAGNTIRNVWDAGIETLGRVTGTTIAFNNIDAAGEAGIASYHGTSWSGNTVFGNNVSHSPTLFAFTREDPLQDGESLAYFENNVFTENTLSLATFSEHVPRVLGFLFSKSDGVPIPGSAIVADGNSFNSNTFSITGPYISPHSLGVDGDGNNKCLGPPPNDPDPASYPLRCTPP